MSEVMARARKKLYSGLMDRSRKIVESAVDEHNPSGVFGLFSGGHDSLCATYMASQHPLFKGAVHINTGIGVEDTREYVRKTCKEYGWPLIEIHAKEDCGQDYDELVKEFGFPGPPHHGKMYNRLKERGLRKLKRDYKTHHRDRLVLVSGCREEESVRRMGTTEPIQPDGVFVWCAAIHYWPKALREQFIEAAGIPRNPVVANLGMSGECLCGAFARHGELDLIEKHYPDVAARIRKLEKEVQACGFKWGWEGRPPESQIGWHEQEEEAGMLCWSCDKRGKK